MEGHSVLIVGAGPTGLALALFLKHQGINVRIIDKGDGPGEASRAMVVQARTLEFYEQLGFAERAIERGVKVAALDLRKQGKRLATLPFGDLGADLSAFPFLLCFPQDHHEQLLIEELAAVGVHVERQTALIDFKEHADHMEVTLEKNKTLEYTQTNYLCGCDGASSTVRHLLKIIFPGGTYHERFFVADIIRKNNGTIAPDHVNLCMEEADFCAVLPVHQSGTERLIGIVPPHLAEKENVTFEDIRPASEKLLGLHVDQVHWFSTYHVHHRVANNFRYGRAFLLGDAAHIHSPAGGQGMNTGIGDAINLAWKLASVIKKINDPKILETYEAERRAFAMILVKTTDRVFQVMTNQGWQGKLWRRFIVPFLGPILLNINKVRRFAFCTVSQIRIQYRASTLSQGHVDEIHAGDRLPWVPQQQGDNYAPLKSLQWQIHIYGDVEEKLRLAAEARGLHVHVFPWSKAAAKAQLIQNALYLIRPDGYIGFASNDQTVEAFEAYCNHLFS